MKASDIMHHFQQVAPWVDWDGRTKDRFLFGDPEVEIEKVAVCWIVTLEQARRAAAAGANVIVSHEPLYYGLDDHLTRGEEAYRQALASTPADLQSKLQARREELERLGLTVLRCHDTWDRFPGVGIPDAWAAHLGFTAYSRDPHSFYGRAEIAPATAGELAQQVLARNPQDGYMKALLGQHFCKRRRYADAVPHLREAVEMYPQRADYQRDLGITLSHVGQDAAASHHLANSMAMNPSDDVTKHYLFYALRNWQHQSWYWLASRFFFEYPALGWLCLLLGWGARLQRTQSTRV
jgi:tetratricopeptide (TPR) repeat protein